MESTDGSGLKTPSPPETRTNSKLTVTQQRLAQRREARLEAHRQRSNHAALMTEFQPDAVEIEQRSVPGGARWTLYAVAALIASTIAWACWARVDQIVIATGKLITTESPVIIQTTTTTPIREMHASFGDRVAAGEVLATLDPTFSEADVKQLQAQQKSLEARIARLKAEREERDFEVGDNGHQPDWLLQYQVFLERQNEYSAKLREFAAESNKLEVQQQSTEREIEQAVSNYADYRKYEEKIKTLAERGSKSDTDVLSRKLQSAEARMKVVTARSRRDELAKELESLETRRSAYIASWRAETVAELVQATDQLNAARQELNKATRSMELVQLKVPDNLDHREFVVLEVADRSVGSVLRPGEPLFKLVPIDVPMEVEIDVAGRDIARLQAVGSQRFDSIDDYPSGSTARVKLASFPYQKHGTLDGVVRTISEGSFEKESGSSGNPSASAETMYRARIRLLEPIQLEETPHNFRLMPGMAATAEIKVGRRRVIEYFLYPLLRYLDTSIREP